MTQDGGWRDSDGFAATANKARELPREPARAWIWGLVLVGLALWAAALAWGIAELPGRVPMHYGSGRMPDRYGSKLSWLLGVGLLPVLLTAWMPWMSRLVIVAPDSTNLRNKQWWYATPERVVRLERTLREFLWLMLALVFALTAGLNTALVDAVLHHADAISPWLFVAMTAAFVVAVTALSVWLIRATQRPRDASTSGLMREH